MRKEEREWSARAPLGQLPDYMRGYERFTFLHLLDYAAGSQDAPDLLRERLVRSFTALRKEGRCTSYTEIHCNDRRPY